MAGNTFANDATYVDTRWATLRALEGLIEAINKANDYERLKLKYPKMANKSYEELKAFEEIDNKQKSYSFVLDNRTPEQQKRDLEASKQTLNREQVRKQVQKYDETVGKILNWTPVGGLMEAGASQVLRDAGYTDESRARGAGAAFRIPFDIAGGAWATKNPLLFTTSTIGALAGDKVADKVNANGLGRLILTGVGGVAGAGVPSLTNNFVSRFNDGWFRVGSAEYRPSMSTLSMGVPKVESRPVWLLLSLPGFLIKSLITGSPLEKQLSKQGTMSLKLLLAYIGRNDVPTIDKELLNRVLLNYAGDTHIDYNTLRQEVLRMIPLYNRVPLTKYESYGTKNLGFDFSYNKAAKKLFVLTREGNELINRRKRWPGDPIGGEIVPGELVREEAMLYAKLYPELFDRLNTFTFESPGIKGNTKHYKGNPIGHSRTYTTTDESDILHVMESLSDWALSGGSINTYGKHRVLLALDFAKRDLALGNYGFGTKEELELKIIDLTKQLESYDLNPIQSHMSKSYLQRQLQENLRYAAENGLTKMRYPTPETAAKIEGYTKVIPQRNFEQLAAIQDNPEYIRACIDINNKAILGELESMYNASPNKNTLETLSYLKEWLYKNPGKSVLEVEGFPNLSYYSPFFRALDVTNDKRLEEIISILNKLLNFDPTPKYLPEHQTILKKYADFPKQFLKLFGKQAQVRTVTDSKGNTWYEVDVPQSYLNSTAEMLFKKGGLLNPVERFRKCRKHRTGGSIQKYDTGGLFLGDSRYYKFSGPMYASLYKVLRSLNLMPHNRADLLARYMVLLTASESGYGSSTLSINYNYGGMKNGSKGWQSFKNMDDFSEGYIKNLLKKFPDFINTNTYDEYMNALFDGLYMYDPDKGKEQYSKDVLGTLKRVNSNIDQWLLSNPDFYKQFETRWLVNIKHKDPNYERILNFIFNSTNDLDKEY